MSYEFVKEKNLVLQIFSEKLATIAKEKVLDEVMARKFRKRSMNLIAAGAMVWFASFCVELGYPGETLAWLSLVLFGAGLMLCFIGGWRVIYYIFKTEYREIILADKLEGIMRRDRKLGNHLFKPLETWPLADMANVDCEMKELTDSEIRSYTAYRFFARYKNGDTATLDWYNCAKKPETIMQHFNAWLEGKEIEQTVYRDHM